MLNAKHIDIRLSKNKLKVVWLILGLFVLGGVGIKKVGGRILGFRDIMELDAEVKLVAVGDVMLGRSVGSGMTRRNEWGWPFEATRNYLQGADVVVANLEAPFGESCVPTDSGMEFCADKRAVEGLVDAGIDAVSLENNHSLNQGSYGKSMSEEWLEENGVLGIVDGEVEVLQRNGMLVGVVAFDDVSRRINETEMVSLINKAEQVADVIVVEVHWGWEYRDTPNERQVKLGHKMIDAGADLVLGHHPHWTQTVEEYKTGVIVYSLGNFVFDQMWSEKTREGWVGEFVLTKDGVKSYKMHEVKIYDYGQPRFEE